MWPSIEQHNCRSINGILTGFRRFFVHCPLLAICLLASAANFALAQPLADDVEPASIFRTMNHFIVNEQKAVFELSSDPQPFLDWGPVRAGFVEYVAKDTGKIVPLNDEHPYKDMADIVAVPFGTASGLRLRVERPKITGSFADVIKQNFPWEKGEIEVVTLMYDEEKGLYRTWYKVQGGTAYAESKDFVHWEKPLRKLKSFQEHEETNLIGVVNLDEMLEGVLQTAAEANPGAGGGSFFVDPTAPPSERFKTTFMAHAKTHHYDDDGPTVDRPISAMTGAGSTVLFGAVSADGMAWRILPEPLCYHDADTQTVVRYDPQLKKYVVYTRLYELSRRTIGFLETSDFTKWPLPVNIMTPGPDQHPSIDYYMNAFCYYPGQTDIRLIFCLEYDRARDIGDIRLATSRDGRVFHFTPGDPIIPPARIGEVGHGMVSPKPGLVRLPDGTLMLVYGGWRVPHKFPRRHTGSIKNRYDDLCATWEPDRLVALEAEENGEFSSVPLVLKGNTIKLNILTDRTGGVKVEMRDESYQPISGRTFDDSDILYGDHVALPITWKGDSDVSDCRGKTIYLNFRLNAAKLYAIQADE